MDPTTIDPTTLIPPALAEIVRAWAPTVIAYLLLATVAVHVLRPIARAFQRWTLITAVTWDDGPARRAADTLDWLCELSMLLLSALPRLAIGGKEATVAKAGARMQKPEAAAPAAHVPTAPWRRRAPPTEEQVRAALDARRSRAPSDGGPIGLLLAAVIVAVLHGAVGCGASALQVHVEVASAFEDSARETGLLVRAYRTEQKRAAARAAFEAGATEEQAIAAAEAAGETPRVRGLVEAQRIYALATHAYVDALWLAEHSAQGVTLAAVMPALRDLLDEYRHLRELGVALGIAELAGLPDTPSFLDGVLPPQLTAPVPAQEEGSR